MLSKKSVFRDILNNPEAHLFLLNSLATGEADSAAGLDEVAAHVEDPGTKSRVLRHHAEEQKHGRLFGQRLRDMGREPQPLPAELDYEQALQSLGFGLPMDRLKDPRPFDADDLIRFFCGSKVNEERAGAEMEGLIEALRADAATHALLSEILNDEYGHIAYATYELQRLAKQGHEAKIKSTLVRYRKLEAEAHKRISLGFMRRLTKMLGYPAPVRCLFSLAIRVGAWWEKVTAKDRLWESPPMSATMATTSPAA